VVLFVLAAAHIVHQSRHLQQAKIAAVQRVKRDGVMDQLPGDGHDATLMANATQVPGNPLGQQL
jgi:hypothetical protein